MADLTPAAIAHLRGLLAEDRHADAEAHHPSCCGSCDECLRICWGYHGRERRKSDRRADGALALALRNAAPDLLAAAEQRDRLRAALDGIRTLCDLSLEDMRDQYGSEQRALLAVIPSMVDAALAPGTGGQQG